MSKLKVVAKIIYMSLGLSLFSQASAQEEYQYQFLPFEEATRTARGTIYPQNSEGIYLSKKDMCHLAVKKWGWHKDQCRFVDQLIWHPIEGVDNVMFSIPNSDGYVRFDDWDRKERQEEVDRIWEGVVATHHEQAERLGITIEVDDWLIEPKLNKRDKYLYYGYRSIWNGVPNLILEMSKFDRRGYVEISLVLDEGSLPVEQIESFVPKILKMYRPDREQQYTAFTEGDKIAAVGTVGVLAALAGVKYGKVAAAGLFALILGVLKKAWFLIIFPFMWVRRRLSNQNKHDGDPKI
jgi:hypothetical protein